MPDDLPGCFLRFGLGEIAVPVSEEMDVFHPQFGCGPAELFFADPTDLDVVRALFTSEEPAALPARGRDEMNVDALGGVAGQRTPHGE